MIRPQPHIFLKKILQNIVLALRIYHTFILNANDLHLVFRFSFITAKNVIHPTKTAFYLFFIENIPIQSTMLMFEKNTKKIINKKVG